MTNIKKKYIVSQEKHHNDRFHIVGDNEYCMEQKNAENEAALLFSGEFCLSKQLVKLAPEKAGKERFKNSLSYLSKAIGEADLSVATVSLNSGWLGKKFLENKLLDFVESAHDNGFSAFMYNGEEKTLRGLSKELKKSAFIMSNSMCKHSVFTINDIKIGLVNHTGNVDDSLKTAIEKAKSSSEFVFVVGKTLGETDAEKIAALGADYIVMNNGPGIEQYYVVETEDGRKVPVMPALGMNLGAGQGKKNKSILLRVKILKDYDGTLHMEDEYIPCNCTTKSKVEGYTAVPTFGYFTGNYSKKYFEALNEEIKDLVGDGLKSSSKKKIIKNKNEFYPQVSINDICSILGVSPDFYTGNYPLDKKVHSVVIRTHELDKDCVAVIERRKKNYRVTAEAAVKAGALFIISEKPEEGLPTLVVKGDPKNAYIKIIKAIRAKYNPFTVSITGTVGKTTTTGFIKQIIGYDHNMLDVTGNYNYYRTVGFCIQKLTPEHTAYVQELHGGTKGAAKLGSNMVLPNACVITNIGDAHLSQVGTVEDVLREKLGIIDAMKPDGILVVNNDNEYLQNLDLPVKVVTYGIENHDSDYHAENIVDYGDHVTFEIVCKEGRYKAVVHCPGIHNVGNAMAAFAIGVFAGVEPYRCIAAISRYRTSGVRQNIVSMDGYKIVADCFSATPDSMLASLKSFKKIKTAEGGKHIAVIGDVADLGDKSVQWHEEFGRCAHELGIEVLITLGDRAVDSAKAARECGTEAYDFMDRDEFENKICEIMRPGDNLLFKSSHPVNLAKSVENLFGIK